MTIPQADMGIPGLQLRDVESADLPVFFEHQRDPEAVRMVGFVSRDRAAFDAHWAKIMADPTVCKQTVLVAGAAAGNLVSWVSDGRRLVGYWIGRDHWGRGVASAALARFLQLLPWRPLHAFVAAHNVASIRVLEKCGFRCETERPASSTPDPANIEELHFELF